ncbi:MAG: COG1361 family protein [Methermicoccaceae archaeon]
MKVHISMVVLAGLFVLLISSTASATVIETDSGIVVDDSYLHVTLVNQDPYPADPGGYVDLVFKVENWGVENAEDVIVELEPEYPFSVDPGTDTVRELGTVGCTQKDEDDEYILLKYKVRVAEDAIDGESEIKLKYSYVSDDTWDSYILKEEITISDPKTDFEVILQDITGNDATLAIANTGDTSAYSVIVSIPKQDGFRVLGTSDNIIGTLDAGDYTLMSFEVVQSNSTEDTGLTVEVAYTDTLGIRRTVQADVEWTSGTDTTDYTSMGAQQEMGGTQSSLSTGMTYIIIGVVGIVGIVLLIELQKRRRKG